MIPVTIRGYLRLRLQRTLLSVGVVVIGLCAGLAHYPLLLAIVAVPALASGVGVTFWILRWTRCPACHQRLGAAMRQAAKDKPTVHKCPRCGVSFDDGMPARR